jgi:hypothetical protein
MRKAKNFPKVFWIAQGEFSAFPAPYKPESGASQIAERLNKSQRLICLGEKGIYSSYT